MSAFFCEANTIADAVAAVRETGVLQDQPDDRELGKQLWRMNVDALTALYGDDPGQYVEEIAAYAAPPASDNPWQRLKSLHCLLYQCSEGDVPDTDLYKAIDEATDLLNRKLTRKDDRSDAAIAVESSKQYSAAEWGRK